MRSLRSPGTDHALARTAAFLVEARALDLVELGLQELHRMRLVLVLRLLGLLRHRDAGRQMGDAHGAFGLVDVLATRTLRTIDVDAQILVVDLDVDVFSLGQHGNGRGGGVDATARFRHRHPLHAMHAAFEFELGVDARAVHFERRVLDAAEVAFGAVHHLGLQP